MNTSLISFLYKYSFLLTIAGVVSMIWTTFAIVSYLFSLVLLFLYVYASTQKNIFKKIIDDELKERERIYNAHFRDNVKLDRLADIDKHIVSDNPNDWRLAIIEADIILDEELKKLGYKGASLGERLRSLTPQQLPSVETAWAAHKVRNNIAHNGSDFVLTKRVAEDTIKQYKQVFGDLGLR